MASQVFEFVFTELKHEIAWEARDIPLNRTNQLPGFYTIKCGQISVQYHLMSANQEDRLFNTFGGNQCYIFIHLNGSKYKTNCSPHLEVTICDLKIYGAMASFEPITNCDRLALQLEVANCDFIPNHKW